MYKNFFEYLLKIVKDSLERGMNEHQKISMDGIKSEIKKMKTVQINRLQKKQRTMKRIRNLKNQ